MTLPDTITLTELERATLSANISQQALVETSLRLARLEAQTNSQAVMAAHKVWAQGIATRVGITSDELATNYRATESGNFERVQNAESKPEHESANNGDQQHQSQEPKL